MDYWSAAIVVLSSFVLLKVWQYMQSPLRRIPTVGHGGILSYLSAFYWVKHSNEMIQEGYEKYHGRAFKIATPDRWQILVSGPQMIEDMRKAPDDVLGATEAAADTLQAQYTIGDAEAVTGDPYHVRVIRGSMTRNLTNVFADVRDEMIRATEDLIDSSESGWARVPAVDTMTKIVCRASNRMFVGVPLCRDVDFLDLGINFATYVIQSATIISLFPTVLKPVATRLLTDLERHIQRGLKHLGPTITFRIEQQRSHGRDWPGKPNDILSWFIDEVFGDTGQESTRGLTIRVLVLNFAAVSSTAMSLTSALYFLAAKPENADILRDEILHVTEKYGWTKQAMDKLIRMDSFLRESQRMVGIGNLLMNRKALKEFVFSDGTVIPKGALVSVPAYAIHHDEEVYPFPNEFQPYRFVAMRDSDNPRMNARLQMVSTQPDYLSFGHGKHACAGRFFAVTEMKILLSHLILTYDMKFENEGHVPEPTWFSTFPIPDMTAEVMFRERALGMNGT